MSKKQQEQQAQELQESRAPDILEFEWEDIEDLYNLRTHLQHVEAKLANACLQFEKSKQIYLSEILKSESLINEMGLSLIQSKNGDASKTYELKLPSSEGEKAYFILK